jgi:hypothetical protein
MSRRERWKNVGKVSEDNDGVFLLDHHGDLQLTDASDRVKVLSRIMSTMLCLLSYADIRKPQRGPTVYNLFVGSQLRKLAAEESPLSRRERMRHAVQEYRALKLANQLPFRDRGGLRVQHKDVSINFSD